jgi:hypothetical protein
MCANFGFGALVSRFAYEGLAANTDRNVKNAALARLSRRQAAASVCNFQVPGSAGVFQVFGSAGGRVSGISNQTTSMPAAATTAMLQNVTLLPK